MWVLIQSISYFFRVLQLLILARVLLSWFPNVDRYSPGVKFIYSATEPIMGPVRDFMSRHINTGMIDFSPIVVLLLLNMVQNFIFRLLLGF